jgi:methyl-accepting chemotaxis protein
MKPIQLPTKVLIERIAEIIPKDISADYYREMLYCCSLPENDEILRILRVMQVLTLLMDRIPSRVMDEREALERLFRETASGLKAVLSSEGINPEDIARTINESLHQRFVASTIPQTAKALAVISEQMKKVSSEFSSTASDIGSSYQGAAEQARQAIDNIRTSVTHASNAAKKATEELSVKFKDAYWVTVTVLALAVLLTG